MHRRLSIRFLLVALLAVTGLTTPYAQNATPSSSTPSVVPRIDVEKYALPNGLEVILSRKPGIPMVSVNLWYHVGPANELPGRTGFAHLFEHMMFQASKHVPEDTHFKFLEAAGASDVNGSTSFDYTNYYETLPSNQLELALWLESDRMGYLLEKVDRVSLANQQDVVRNERRQRTENQPYGMAEEAIWQTLFPKGHPYYAVVIGSHADIQAAQLEDVKSFFKQYYAPNNATLTLVGDFEPAQAKQLVEKYFGTLKRGGTVPPIMANTPPVTEERRKIVPSRVELQRVSIAWLTPAFFTPGDAEADVTAQILGGGRSSRLYKKLVYERQIAQDVSAVQQSFGIRSVFQIDATARPGRTAAELEQAITEEIALMAKSGVEPREVERARNTIETNIVGSLESITGLADRLNSYNHFLKTPNYVDKDFARYGAVTPAAVQAFARDQLRQNARVVVHAVPGEPDFGPAVPTPPAPPKTAVGEGAESINAAEPWRENPPKPAAAKPLQLATPVSTTLPNGLTLILSERKAVPIVAASLVFRTGSDANPLDKPGLANFVAAMLDEGTTTRNALQIADEVAVLGGSLGTGSSMDSSTITARSLSRNFGPLLNIVSDVVLHPSFPAAEVERQRAQRLAQLVQQRENPGAVAAATTASALYGPKHPYGYPEIGTEASVKAITAADMQAFWKQNFVPNNAALVVAGDITMNDLRAIAEKAFGTWQRGTPAQPALAAPGTTTAKVVIVNMPKAQQTELRVAAIGAPRSSTDFRPLQLMNLTLGGNFASRINMNLREKNGYTYGASSQFTFRKAAGPFQVGSGVRTDVTGPAIGEIFNELRTMIQQPQSADELARAKDGMSNSLPGAFETNNNAVGNFANTFIYNLGLDYYSKYAEQVAAVTQAQTADVAKRYVSPDRMVVVAVGDIEAIEPEIKKLNLGPIEVRQPDGSVVFRR
jgi:zinc protease